MQKLIKVIINIILLISLNIMEVYSQNYQTCIDNFDNLHLSNTIKLNNDGYISSINRCNLISYGVDVTNGNLIFFEKDIKWYLFEDEFLFKRIYNNNSIDAGKFGHKWHHNFEIFIDFKNNKIAHLYDSGIKSRTFHKSKDIYISESGLDTLYIARNGQFEIKLENNTILAFNNTGHLSKLTDSNHNSFHLLYNKNNLLQILVDPVGRELFLNYNNSNQLSSIISPDNKTTSYYYNNRKQLSRTVYPDGSFTSYEYDINKRLILIQDINTAVYRIKYSKSGKIRSIIDPMNISEFYDFKNFPSSKCIFTDGEENKWIYNTDGDRITKIKFPDGRSQEISWNKRGQLIGFVNTSGIRSNYIYIKDKLSQIRQSNNETATFVRDNNGNIIHYKSSIDEIKFGYNKLNQIISKNNIQDKLQESYSRNLWGLISNLRIGDQKYKAYFDIYGNIYKIKSPYGMELYNYDILGNMLSYTDTLNNTFSASFDYMNRITNISISNNLIFSFEYNEAGNLIKVTGPDGNSNDYIFDKLNRLTEEKGNSKRFLYYDKSGLPIGNSIIKDNNTNLMISDQMNQASIKYSLYRHPLYNISEQIKAGKSSIHIPIKNKKRKTKFNLNDDWVIFFDL